jgi:hypothetical protein
VPVTVEQDTKPLFKEGEFEAVIFVVVIPKMIALTLVFQRVPLLRPYVMMKRSDA